MNSIVDTLVVLGLFAVRLVVPLAITLLVGYLFLKLDTKWEAEAEQQWHVETEAKALAHWPKVQERARQVALTAGPMLASSLTCSMLNAKCSGEDCASCPASKQPALPCWLARQQSEGRLPVECIDCDLFLPQQMEPQRLM